MKLGSFMLRSCNNGKEKYTKKRDARGKMFFCQSKPIVFFCSPLLLQKLPIAAIQKFCYHGNMMSQFSFLLQVALIEYSEFTGYVTHGI